LAAVCADVEDAVHVEVSEQPPEVSLEVELTGAPSPTDDHVETLFQDREDMSNGGMEQMASSRRG
jgi:hypothetical protein